MREPVTDPAILEGYNRDALGYTGSPEGLFRPESEAGVEEIMQHCHANRLALTPAALRSSTTGSCVCHGGFLLSTEKLDRILEIRREEKTATVQPGVNLGRLKQLLEEEKLFFPPDPTSENDCTLGGAVATNASGARTLKYGAIRHWIKRLRVVLPPGRTLEFHRLEADKNAAGYFGFQDPLQFFIGSEGTLGVITEIEIQCLDLPPGDISFYAFFPDEASTLAAAVTIRRSGWPVRCLEYFDGACLDLLRREQNLPVPPGAGGLLFFEEETTPDRAGTVAEEWLPRLEALGARVDDTRVGDTRARQEEMRRFRHAIPATLNEQSLRRQAAGGGKISTDWAVRCERLPGLMHEARLLCREHGMAEVFCFGHIGNGHPHFNLLARDGEERKRAKSAVFEMARRVAALGGTISAEHGVGKVKREFLPLFYPPEVLSWMRAFKLTLDPRGILAPGNIFE